MLASHGCAKKDLLNECILLKIDELIKEFDGLSKNHSIAHYTISRGIRDPHIFQNLRAFFKILVDGTRFNYISKLVC